MFIFYIPILTLKARRLSEQKSETRQRTNPVVVAGPRVVQSAATRLKQPVSFKLCLRGTSELLNRNGLSRGPRFMVPEEGGMLIKF